MSDSEALLQLMSVRGVGPRTMGRVLDALSSEGGHPSDLEHMAVPDLVRLGLSLEYAEAFRRGRQSALESSEELDRRGIRMLVRGDGRYPSRLAQILGESAPAVLFAAGNTALLAARGISFCGSRNATEAGTDLARSAADKLSREGLNVVSGHATGVDLAAHAGALSAGHGTTFVLAEGILRYRPHRDLADLVDDSNWVAISEFSPNAAWSVGSAMQRNATVVGLGIGLLAIEPGSTGGTLDAAKKALKLDLSCFVAEAPGRKPSESGVPELIRAGARAIPVRKDGSPDLESLAFQVKTDATDASTASDRTKPNRQRDLFGT